MIKGVKLLFLLISLIIYCGINSCKKSSQSSISSFLTQRLWNLALLQRYKYVNESLVKTDTINTVCALNQTLLFKADNTYNFGNYNCKAGALNGNWSFTPDMLYLNLNSVISQTSKDSKPNVARIINLGQYSLVFDAGDVNIPHAKTDTVVIYRYGFIHSN